jgi:hypothetical protein
MASYKEALAKAEEIDKKLLATDDIFKGAVMIKSLNCASSIFYADAGAVKWGDWYLVFTEHHGTHVFNNEDYHIYQYKRTTLEELV